MSGRAGFFSALLVALGLCVLATPAAQAQVVTLSSQTTVAGNQVIGECSDVVDYYTSLLYDGMEADCSLTDGSNPITWPCETGFQESGQTCFSPGLGLPTTAGTAYTTSANHFLFFQQLFDEFGDPLFDPFGNYIYYDPAGFILRPSLSCGPSCQIFGTGVYEEPPGVEYTEVGSTVDTQVSTSITPPQATLGPKQTQAFSSNHPVHWSIQPPMWGSIDGNGLYKAPASVTTVQTDTVEACNATNNLDCAQAEVTLIPVAVSIDEDNFEVLPGTTHAFKAKVTPDTFPQGVVWSLLSNPNNAGHLADPNANPVAFTASTVPSSSTVLLQACSTQVPAQCAVSTVFVPAVSIVLSANANPFLAPAAAQDAFTASVNGTTNNAVAWSISPAMGAGTITGNGLDTAQYQAPSPVINLVAQPTITACLTAAPQICSLPFALTIVPPVAFTLAPTTWPSGQNTAVTLTGTGFGTQPAVKISDPLIHFTQTSLVTNPTASVLQGVVSVLPQASGELATLTLIDTTTPLTSAPQATTTVTVSPMQLTVAVFPPSVTLQEGQSQAFTPTVTCKTAGGLSCVVSQAVQCSVAPNLGSMNPSTCVYTATAGVSVPTQIQGKACSLINLLLCGTFTITLTPTVVAVTPASTILTVGRTQQFAAAVTGNSVTSVRWSITPQLGTISPSGLYTAPTTITSVQTVTISACSTVDNSRCGQAAVNLNPLPSLSPVSLTFLPQGVSTASSPQTAVLTNSGSSALSISGITTTGDFTQTNTCGSSLAAGGSCNINVTFTPTAAGPRTGTLTVSHNAANSPGTVALSGTGVVISLTPASLTFPGQVVGTASATQTVTLTNSSTSPLAVPGISVSGDFNVTNNCPTSLAVNTSCTLTVVFAPILPGARTGSLSISGTVTSPPAVTLSGTGLPLIPILDGITPSQVTVGSSGFTLVATGSSFLRNAVVRVNGNERPTTYVNSPLLNLPLQLRATISAADLASTGSLSITVFNPGASGGESGALPLTVTSTPIPLIGSLSPVRVVAGGPALTLTVSGSNFPADSVVQVNNTIHATTWVSATQLTLTLSDAEIATSGLLSITVLSASTQTSNAAPLLVFRYGDLNSDNKISVSDLSTLASYLAGNLTLFDPTVAELNCDGVVNITDLSTLANYLAGNIHTLPACPQ